VVAAGAGLAALPLLPRGAFAAEPHRFSHGAFDITVFSDGFFMLPAEIILPDAAPEERPDILKRLGGTAENAPFHVNIPLIHSGQDLILIDNGSGDNFQPTAGRLAANLMAAGIDPASITTVVFTHVHPDHSGATVGPDGKLLYPNAQYFISEAEAQFWTDPDYEKIMPAALHDFARGAQRDLSPSRTASHWSSRRGDSGRNAGPPDPRPHARPHLSRACGQRQSRNHRRRRDQQRRVLRTSRTGTSASTPNRTSRSRTERRSSIAR
jgi:hypothetical protein